jgi:hypothetical protein
MEQTIAKNNQPDGLWEYDADAKGAVHPIVES